MRVTLPLSDNGKKVRQLVEVAPKIFGATFSLTPAAQIENKASRGYPSIYDDINPISLAGSQITRNSALISYG